MINVPAKRWVVSAIQVEHADELALQLGVPVLVAELLIQRGYDTAEKARRFLLAGPGDLYDPYLMLGMKRAVDRIRQAIETGEQVVVYGDYDVDGVTSTAVLWLGLKELGANVRYYIPDRFEEGYGLNQTALAMLQETCSLCVTVDNGIAAVEPVAFARSIGLDIIVTDHHHPPELLPDAYAILNPKQPGCAYPDQMLAGVGIAFKLVQALWGRVPEELSDLAALGTISDLAPLVDENRVLTRMGLKRLNEARRTGIQSLCQQAGLQDKPLTPGHIGFQLGPRINASGRLQTALTALQLLIDEDPNTCDTLAKLLDAFNLERQALCEQILAEAVELVENAPEFAEDPILVIGKAGWNTGVVGIVAARLVEKYYRPVLVLSYLEDGTAKGSARSISGIDLYAALAGSAELYDHFGGHKMAAGLSLPQEHIPALRAALREWVNQHVPADTWIPKLQIDRFLHASELTEDTASAMGQLEPFGFGNPQPVLALAQVTPHQLRTVGRDQAHLQFVGLQGKQRVQAIGFRMGDAQSDVQNCLQVDLAGDLALTSWQGRSQIQFTLKAWRPSPVQIQMIRDVPQKTDWIESRSWSESAAEGKRMGIVSFSDQNLEQVKTLLTGYPWQQANRYEFYAITEAADFGSVDFSSCACTVVVDLPFNVLQWQRFCQLAALSGKLYFLIGQADLLQARDLVKVRTPARERFAAVYRVLQEAQMPLGLRDLHTHLPFYTLAELEWMLSVFEELELLHQTDELWQITQTLVKRPLTDSVRYQGAVHEVQELLALYRSLAQLDEPEFTDWLINQIG
ncbi:MAG: hypothetical protein JWN30_2836 [Bacilli bacterium]|nr:hypothetical protein [Bacilli bacterium]